MGIKDWKIAVCEIREAYEHSEDIAFVPEREATTAYIIALECLCSAYEIERGEMKASAKPETSHVS